MPEPSQNYTDHVPTMASPGCYVITVQGHIDDQWTDWFGGLAITHTTHGITVLSGVISDQSALHGILAQIRDLSLPLLSIHRQPPENPGRH